MFAEFAIAMMSGRIVGVDMVVIAVMMLYEGRY